jgi:uncharacterized repeat protein (TIGR03803 family)
MRSRYLASFAVLLSTVFSPLAYAGLSGNPHINSVGQIWPRSFQIVEISGYGFGTHEAYDGNSQFIAINDLTQNWSAGHTGDPVTMYVTSWTDKLITIEYFDGAYGTGNYSFVAGDTISVEVWDPETGQGPGKAQTTVSANVATLYNFSRTPTAGGPSGTLIADENGNYYGNASGPGDTCDNYYSCGVVYELSQAGGVWTETDLYSFQGGSTGMGPLGALVRDSAGNLYGAASGGGSTYCFFGCGLIFEISNGSEIVLHTFENGAGDGLQPMAGLTMDAQGNLFGTTASGGANNYGTVFELTPNGSGGWNYATVYSFQGGINGDGAKPEAPLTLGPDGNLYGTTYFGGNAQYCPEGGYGFGCGTVYEILPQPGAGVTERVLHAFIGQTNGVLPNTGVTFDEGGNLYGVTYVGGPECGYRCNAGLAYALSPQSNGTWKETILFDFSNNVGNPDYAVNPVSQLTYYKGALYGYANGGASEKDTIYTLTQNGRTWTEATTYSFGGYPDGAGPTGRPFLSPDGTTLYGVTAGGGLNQAGTLFVLP